MKYWLGLLSPFLFASCISDPPEEALSDKRAALVRTVESAHRKDDLLKYETVSFDLELQRRNQPVLHATIVQRTDGTRVRIRKENGSDILFDGQDSWLSPAISSDPEARFDLFAWHYFFCLPWKLSDPGARWQSLPDRVFEQLDCSAGRLSFVPGTGDSSDDWFLVFSDKREGLLRGAVYVVTFGGKPVETAEKKPRSIVYTDFRRVAGIPVAHQWKFYEWNTDSLDDRREAGSAVIRNVRFADERPGDFAVPPEAVKI
jgi:hypothetical protein